MSTKQPSLPTLTFQNRFSNGLVVTLTVSRKEFTPMRIASSHRDFTTPDIEREYLAWVAQICERMVDEKLITEGEIIALALRNAGIA